MKKDLTHYLLRVLTVEQMIENDCPIPFCFVNVFSKLDGRIETPEADPDADASASQKASADYLTISLSAFSKLSLYALLHTLTSDPSFSGMTAQAVGSITMTLPNIQAHLTLQTLITPTTILLCHSLDSDSDLRALQLSHSRCINTALISIIHMDDL